MRILQVAPLWERVPPVGYGGIENMMSLLTEELVRTGHDVSLAATADSVTNARLLSVWGQSLRTSEGITDYGPYNWLHVANALSHAGEFDIVHNHASELGMAMHQLTRTPMLTTLHNVITPDARIVWEHYQGYYNTPSRSARRNVHYPNYAGVVYHGLDVGTYPFQRDKESFLLYLSRMSPEKGPHRAIEVAKRAGMKLVLAGNVGEADAAFFERDVAPLVDGKQIEYVGEADARMKRDLFKRAKGLLFPIDWNEPFGLVMIEAMATGTPVLTFPFGAAPEVVWHGLSGYVVNDVEEMARATRELDRFDPGCIRDYVTRRFSAQAMTRGYVRMYNKILERTELRRPRFWSATGPRALTG